MAQRPTLFPHVNMLLTLLQITNTNPPTREPERRKERRRRYTTNTGAGREEKNTGVN